MNQMQVMPWEHEEEKSAKKLFNELMNMLREHELH